MSFLNFVDSITPAQYVLVMGPWVLILFVWLYMKNTLAL